MSGYVSFLYLHERLNTSMVLISFALPPFSFDFGKGIFKRTKHFPEFVSIDFIVMLC